MKGNKVVVGIFKYMDDLLRAIDNARKDGLEFRVYSPFYSHDIEHHATKGKSPVRRVTLVGAIVGCTFGWSLAILCSMDWPLRVSAKDIVSVPGFFVIGYECTILIGSLFNLAALIFFCKLPHMLSRRVGYDPRFTDDKFGLVIGCEGGEIDAMKGRLLQAGAEEVDVKDGL